jgi:nickel-dependent lactate racemase
VITNGGGFPLDQTFYQTVKGMCTALPALNERTVLLHASNCGEGLGSREYSEMLLRYGRRWEDFLRDISDVNNFTVDQWEFQMQTRILKRIGIENLRLVTDGIKADVLQKLALTPVTGSGDAQMRLQRAVDDFVAANPSARIAVIPEGPYTIIG